MVTNPWECTRRIASLRNQMVKIMRWTQSNKDSRTFYFTKLILQLKSIFSKTCTMLLCYVAVKDLLFPILQRKAKKFWQWRASIHPLQNHQCAQYILNSLNFTRTVFSCFEHTELSDRWHSARPVRNFYLFFLLWEFLPLESMKPNWIPAVETT